jgi:hypothetical protein
MVADPAECRWSSDGEAMGATDRSGAKAKAGLVRAITADKGGEPGLEPDNCAQTAPATIQGRSGADFLFGFPPCGR